MASQIEPTPPVQPNTVYLPTLVPAIDGLLRLGLAVERIEAVFQRSLEEIRAPLVRVPMLMSRRFWDLAVEFSGDPGIGLELGLSTVSRQPNGMSYLFDAESSLKRGFEHLARYMAEFQGHFRSELVFRGDEVQMRLYDCGSLQATPQMVDYVFAGLCALVRRKMLSSGQPGSPLRHLSFAHEALTDVSRHAVAFKASVSWEQPWHALHFDRELFVREVSRRDDALVSRLQALMADINQYSRPTLLAEVCDQIAHELSNGPTLEAFCNHRHITRRTARRRLQAQGGQYSDLLDEHRRYRAYDLLKDSSLNLIEVTDLLGYRDLSSFSRAFQRWYGSSPGTWRERFAKPQQR
ncbi:AraC family transcriptional regulator [Pseudomonas sp. H9]|uniref:helix-turn-helix transcriptional regulator n=1 Tax=Pseudomonas sp. H9 TaxID=483968 RepID=UPI00105795DA|nr:AraC family transcriptional regulator [Pseudomonas sp. H9]TDF83872.1 AraC family transcriptional regulator [Pseudomonas sp. H9]